jgi:hypothetical protein
LSATCKGNVLILKLGWGGGEWWEHKITIVLGIECLSCSWIFGYIKRLVQNMITLIDASVYAKQHIKVNENN